MRVVHLVTQFQSKSEANWRFVLSLARQQRRDGIGAEVLVLESIDDTPGRRTNQFDCVEGVPVHRIRASLYRRVRLAASAIGPFDIVHIHEAGHLGQLLALMQFVHRKPLILSLYGDRPAASGDAAGLIERLALSKYKRVIVHDPAHAVIAGMVAEHRLRVMELPFRPQLAQAIVEEYRTLLGSNCRKILGVAISPFDQQRAVVEIDHVLAAGQRLNVCFANAHSLNVARENDRFRSALTGFLVLNDGLGVDLASRVKYGRPFAANLNGTDFVPHFLRATKRRLRIFLVGTTDAAVAQAALKIGEYYPRHRVVGWHNGFFSGPDEIDETCRMIQAAHADCVLVGMGNPLQEFWIQEYGAKSGASLLMAVGALFDFQAETVRRAPLWIRNMRCEWLYRFLQEPRRLLQRYLVGNWLFMGRVFADARL